MLLHEELTYDIVGACFQVYNDLGHGFVESVYAAALAIEFAARGIEAQREHPIHVTYKGATVGDFRADFLVAQRVILEVKAVDRLTSAHDGQVLNYLKASQLQVGLLFNFGPRSERRRLVWTSQGKQVDNVDTVDPVRVVTPSRP